MAKSRSEVAVPSGRSELQLVPPTKFHAVIDLNNNFAIAPIDTLEEAKYKAAELAAAATGPKPIGIFQYVGGVTKEQRPLFWQEAQDE